MCLFCGSVSAGLSFRLHCQACPTTAFQLLQTAAWCKRKKGLCTSSRMCRGFASGSPRMEARTSPTNPRPHPHESVGIFAGHRHPVVPGTQQPSRQIVTPMYMLQGGRTVPVPVANHYASFCGLCECHGGRSNVATCHTAEHFTANRSAKSSSTVNQFGGTRQIMVLEVCTAGGRLCLYDRWA